MADEVNDSYLAGRLVDVQGAEVRAEGLAALLLDPVRAAPGRVARLRLRSARITGEFDLSYAEVPAAVEFEDCVFEDAVRLAKATVRNLQFIGCELPSLDLDTVDLRNHLGLVGSRLGPLSLYNARVGGQVDVSGARLSGGVNAELLRVGGTFYARDARVDGLVLLRGARITGSLDLTRARLAGGGGEALSASRMVVGDDLTAEGVQVEGGVRLHGTQVDGAIELHDATLRWPGKAALDAYRLRAGGGVFCTGAFVAAGSVRLPSAHIAGRLSVRGMIEGELDLDGSTVEGTMDVRGGRVQGRFGLRQTVVTGEVDLTTAHLGTVEARGLRTPALNLSGARIADELDLRNTTLGVLRDDPAHWPASLRLNGATYDALEPPLPAARRLGWLRRGPDGYLPHAYEQLSATYRRLGQDRDARAVLAAKHRHRYETATRPAKAWGRVQDVTLGFGYRPGRAGAWLLALVILGTVLFAGHPPHPVGTTGPSFNPFIYTIELLVPFVGFGQRSAYQPDGAWQWLAYLLIAAGWLLATAVAAAITRAVTGARTN